MTIPNNSDTYLPGTIFIPSNLQIASITQDYPAILMATVNATVAANTYVPGQLIRLFIPYDYGMQQANGLTVTILAITGLTFTLELDSRLFDPFVVPIGNVPQPASMAPAGSRNLQYISNNLNQVAFQPLNDRGN